MAYRLAIASSDGIVVDQHFGRADRFHIVEIDADTNTYQYVGARDTERICQGHYHEEASYDRVRDVLSDIQAVFVAKIGAGSFQHLDQWGLSVYEAPFPIEPLMKKIIADRTWEVDKWQYPTKN